MLQISTNNEKNQRDEHECTRKDARKPALDELQIHGVVQIHTEDPREVGAEADAARQDGQGGVSDQQLVSRSVQTEGNLWNRQSVHLTTRTIPRPLTSSSALWI